MAARGTESKNILFAKLMEIYSGAFWEDEGKVLRVPMDENGQRIELKVTLTAAKTNLGGDSVASAFDSGPAIIPTSTSTTNESNSLEPTEEEKQNIQSLIEALNL